MEVEKGPNDGPVLGKLRSPLLVKREAEDEEAEHDLQNREEVPAHGAPGPEEERLRRRSRSLQSQDDSSVKILGESRSIGSMR